jgi:hypothetical protein
LFGAACLKLTLERSGSAASEIYEGTLRDLGLQDAEVAEYLRSHRAMVEAALAAHRGPRGEEPS